MLVSAESLISRISQRKRTFQQNYFSLLLRGPIVFDLLYVLKNAKNSRDASILRNIRSGVCCSYSASYECQEHKVNNYIEEKATTDIVFHFHDLQRILVSHVICR